MFKLLILSISKDFYKEMTINKIHKKKHKQIWAWNEEENPKWYQVVSKDPLYKTTIKMQIEFQTIDTQIRRPDVQQVLPITSLKEL